MLKTPTPDPWYEYLERHVGFYPHLPAQLSDRFHDYLRIFVWEKHFIGAGGMEITDEVRVVIAAAAVRMVLNLDLSYYDRLTEIVVYPSHYRHPNQNSVILGEAQNWGTVVLSYEAVLHGLKNAEDGEDTADDRGVSDLADRLLDKMRLIEENGHRVPRRELVLPLGELFID